MNIIGYLFNTTMLLLLGMPVLLSHHAFQMDDIQK